MRYHPMRRAALMLALLLCGATLTALPTAAAATWQPEAATYGVGEQSNVSITMDDGTVLRANVYYPTDPGTGAAAAGPFPVVLTQTPYGKDRGELDSTLGDLGMGKDTYLVERGYIHVVSDVRGTGASQGLWSFLQPVESSDGAALVRWAAALPHSSGSVGLLGESYGGLNQLTTASNVGPGSPLKAVLPIVPGADMYRDVLGAGGVPDPLLALIYLGSNVPQSYVNAIDSLLHGGSIDVGDLTKVLLDHLGALGVLPVTDLVLGGPAVYDNDYWAQRRPVDVLPQIVANDVPTLILGGWHDAFQRAEPLLYAGLQNAAAGRPSTAPMTADQQANPKYQLVQGPWYHSTIGEQGSTPHLAVNELALRWFDQWLKGEDTGVAATSTPLHTYDLGTKTWTSTSSYPFSGATPTKLYFGAGRTGTVASTNDGTLSTSPPTSGGSDSIAWSTVPLCSPSISQFVLLGADQQLGNTLGLQPNPCAADDRPVQLGPDAATYTTEPMTAPTTIAGPIAAHIYATVSSLDSQWVVRVEDVAPDGTSAPLTRGGLLGSLRQLDLARTWTAPDGKPILPYHPYTQASAQTVPAGELASYDVEVFPTHATVQTGHRIRVTIGTDDSPALLATTTQLPSLVGGVYDIHRDPGAASYVELPLTTTGIGAPCDDTLYCP